MAGTKPGHDEPELFSGDWKEQAEHTGYHSGSKNFGSRLRQQNL
jgi:hypothetical protein